MSCLKLSQKQIPLIADTIKSPEFYLQIQEKKFIACNPVEWNSVPQDSIFMLCG